MSVSLEQYLDSEAEGGKKYGKSTDGKRGHTQECGL